jgi:hypothetical protein
MPRLNTEDFLKLRDILDKGSCPTEELTAFVLDRKNDRVIHIDVPISVEQARELGWVE